MRMFAFTLRTAVFGPSTHHYVDSGMELHAFRTAVRPANNTAFKKLLVTFIRSCLWFLIHI